MNLFDLLFRSGVPYDAEKNEFLVRFEDIPRLQMQEELMKQEQQMMKNHSLMDMNRNGFNDF